MLTLAQFKGSEFTRADTGAKIRVLDESPREFIISDDGLIRFVPKSHLISLYQTGAILPLDKTEDPG